MPGSSLCKRCGQPIIGAYVTALGATWHPEHFVCAGCALPLADARFHLYQNNPYHIACYERDLAPRCVYCGRPLTGTYLVNYWGERFCAEHEDQYAHCSFCGRLVSPQDRESGAERVRCSVCRSSAVETAEDAKPIFRELIQWVSNQGLRYNNLRLSLELCGAQKLATYLQSHTLTHSLGATMSTTYLENGRLVSTEIQGVAVLLGLPETLFRGVTIHELGHVWLVVQAVLDLPLWAEEGFCELLAYRYYQTLSTSEAGYHAQTIERNPNPTYGEGFRRVQALANTYGFPRLLEVLQTTKHLPGHP